MKQKAIQNIKIDIQNHIKKSLDWQEEILTTNVINKKQVTENVKNLEIINLGLIQKYKELAKLGGN